VLALHDARRRRPGHLQLLVEEYGFTGSYPSVNAAAGQAGLPIAFVAQPLTSYGGLKLLRGWHSILRDYVRRNARCASFHHPDARR
jgi:hypothetical protein